ncbi:DUF4148 domain-containing protein [Paraburkholderia sp. A1RI-2L]|uniref:DUF4148 domain-containing protein n=1 Tax=Paraburkholderia sp. A1RI-2L TaxID=3028367 RepID=UPI003B7E8AEC
MNVALRYATLVALLFSMMTSAHARGMSTPFPERGIRYSLPVSSGDHDDTSVDPKNGNASGSLAASVGQTSCKSRAQVQAEILEAGEEGMLPLRWVDYPPSATTRARTRERFLRLEEVWKKEGIIPATNVDSVNGKLKD